MTNYVRERYPDGVCEVYANMFDDGRCALVICIQATKLNPSSMWSASFVPVFLRLSCLFSPTRTGRWRSTWTITLNGAQAEAKGNLQVCQASAPACRVLIRGVCGVLLIAGHRCTRTATRVVTCSCRQATKRRLCWRFRSATALVAAVGRTHTSDPAA